MSEDALSAVPRSLREAAYGLGATRLETAMKIVLPAAASGVASAFIVAMSRAVGETMIMTIAVGAGPKFTLNPFEGAETITGHIARISTGDLSFGSIDYNSLFALGLALFVMTLVLNLISGAITRSACGSTTRRRICAGFSPSARAASHWPDFTDWMPLRTISEIDAEALTTRPTSSAANTGVSDRPPRMLKPPLAGISTEAAKPREVSAR